MSTKEFDVIIVGGGPGGASAALYASRGGLSTCILHDGKSALHKAERIQNYYGAGEIKGGDLYDRGLMQAQSVGAVVVREQATFIRFDGETFLVTTPAAEYTAKRLVIATGAPRKPVDIPGVAELEGMGVSYCAVCDGFFYRKKTVAVIGDGEYAAHEYGVLNNIAAQTYLLTNGKTPSFTADNTVMSEIQSVSKDGRIAVKFNDGGILRTDGLFIAVGTLGSSGIAKSVGVLTDERGFIVTDDRGMTNVPGLYAAGDCAAGIKQIGKAVCDGVTVGMDLLKNRP